MLMMTLSIGMEERLTAAAEQVLDAGLSQALHCPSHHPLQYCYISLQFQSLQY